ncbi:MAG: DUF2604 domain-containing protein [Polyangiales bacterium]
MIQKLCFVVNGDEHYIDAHDDEPIAVVAARALVVSRNTARPIEEWELRYMNGVKIEVTDKAVGDHGFARGAYLYLTLCLGAGGARASRAPHAPLLTTDVFETITHERLRPPVLPTSRVIDDAIVHGARAAAGWRALAHRSQIGSATQHR